MDYITIKIGTPGRPLVYEKDFTVADVFGEFVREVTSKLVFLGLVKDGEHFWATIKPGHVEMAGVSEGAFYVGDVPDRNGKDFWLTLDLGDGGPSEQPIRYFTLGISTAPPDTKRYYREFPISETEPFVGRIKTTMEKMGLTKADDRVRIDFFARRGDSPHFDREIIHDLPTQLSDLEITLTPVKSDEDFTERPLPTCIYGCADHGVADFLTVFFRAESLRKLGEHVRETASHDQESGGILAGEVFRQPGTEQLHVIVEDHIAAEQTHADEISLRFTHETWQALQIRKRAKFGDRLRVVGWYHTHPPMSLVSGDREIRTVKFFSPQDLNVQRQIFRKPWQIALVMDAESPEHILFRWNGNLVEACDYHVCE